MSFVIDFWGDYACFNAPGNKVERFSLPVPTPGAVRGMLGSIYVKPQEFWWQVDRIEIMNPIDTFSYKRNELNKKASGKKPIDSTDPKNRTQRTIVMLKNVKYRITAHIVARDWRREDAIISQMARRLDEGSCFRQPTLGMSECIAYFARADMSAKPVPLTMSLGLIPYDTHIPCACQPGYSGMDPSAFRCNIIDGVIEVPPWGSPEIRMVEEEGADYALAGVV